MPRARENILLERVTRVLKAQGCYVLKTHGGGKFQQAGLPDVYVVSRKLQVPGHAVWLEAKTVAGSLTERQRLLLKRWRTQGVPAMVLRLFDEGSCRLERDDGQALTAVWPHERVIEALGEAWIAMSSLQE